MRYNLSRDIDVERIRKRMDVLIERGAVVDLTERSTRSLGQNAYLHLILGVVAMETGNTLADTKEWYFKEICNGEMFHRQHFDKLGNCIDTLRSTAELSKEEMSIAIDRFKRWAASEGIYIPEIGDEQRLAEIDAEIGRMSDYL